MQPVQVNDSTFQKEVLDSEIPVLVDFWAPWCAPCRMIAPIVEQIAQEYEGKIKTTKVNTDENIRYASQLGITGIPTMVFFKGGKEAGRLVGFMPKEHIERKIQELL